MVEALAEEVRLQGYFFSDADDANRLIAKLPKAGESKMREVKISQLCLQDMAIETRYEVIFRHVFRDRVRSLTNRALEKRLAEERLISR